MNLIKKIELWQKEGLITQSQGLAIKDFENKLKKPTLIYMLLFLSVFCIGVGVISLIASNWKSIPYGVKIALDFTLLIVVAYGIFWSDRNKKIFMKEALVIFYAILIIATIGLVAQIFHLKSNGYGAALFWSVMTVPLFYITKKSILPFIWFPVFNYAFISWIFDKFPNIEEFFIKFFKNNYTIVNGYYITLITLLGCFIYDKYKEKLAYLTKPLFTWAIISIIFETVIMEIKSNSLYYIIFGYNEVYFSYLPFLIIGLFALVALSMYLYRENSALYIYCVVMILLLFYLLDDASMYLTLVKAASTLSILALLMTYAYRNNNSRLFNFAGALVAARVFIIYIQLFGSLLSTGVGLIISGLVLLAIAFIWHKISIQIKNRFKEKVNEA